MSTALVQPFALITGGAGFIGSHLARALLERGMNVCIVDNLSTGRASNLPQHPGLEFISGDLSEALGGPLRGRRFDQIYHLAASVGVRLIIDQPITCIETNVVQTAELLKFALTCGRGGTGTAAPTLIASSSEVYGKTDKSPFSEEDDVVYGPTSRARWSYAATKAIDEYLALAYHQQHGLPVVITRFFNTVGPRQVGEYGMVLPTFVAAALNNQPLPIFGDGRQSRCFCDVRDVVRALPKLLETPSCLGRVLNIGSDRPISIDDLATLVIQTVGSTGGKKYIPYDAAYAAGFEDLRHRKPDLSRIRAAIGFEPSFSLTDTIRDIAAAMRGTPAVQIAASSGVLR